MIRKGVPPRARGGGNRGIILGDPTQGMLKTAEGCGRLWKTVEGVLQGVLRGILRLGGHPVGVFREVLSYPDSAPLNVALWDVGFTFLILYSLFNFALN